MCTIRREARIREGTAMRNGVRCGNRGLIVEKKRRYYFYPQKLVLKMCFIDLITVYQQMLTGYSQYSQ